MFKKLKPNIPTFCKFDPSFYFASSKAGHTHTSNSDTHITGYTMLKQLEPPKAVALTALGGLRAVDDTVNDSARLIGWLSCLSLLQSCGWILWIFWSDTECCVHFTFKHTTQTVWTFIYRWARQAKSRWIALGGLLACYTVRIMFDSSVVYRKWTWVN